MKNIPKIISGFVISMIISSITEGSEVKETDPVDMSKGSNYQECTPEEFEQLKINIRAKAATHNEIQRVLTNFANNMNEYYQRIESTKVVSIEWTPLIDIEEAIRKLEENQPILVKSTIGLTDSYVFLDSSSTTPLTTTETQPPEPTQPKTYWQALGGYLNLW